ncbi:hypothetical protein LINPERHAP1_LOCUS33978 [Linum perenne]
MEGGMEEEMEVDLLFYEAREVDPDYEFDAPMFFDFVREETLAEAIIAQRWFDSATSYPPSPFVAKLELREEILLKNINTSPKTKDVEYVTTSLDDDDGGGDLGPGRAATTVGDGHKGDQMIASYIVYFWCFSYLFGRHCVVLIIGSQLAAFFWADLDMWIWLVVVIIAGSSSVWGHSSYI